MTTQFPPGEFPATVRPGDRFQSDESMAVSRGAARKKIVALLPLESTGSLSDGDVVEGLVLSEVLAKFGKTAYNIVAKIIEQNPNAWILGIAVDEAAGANAVGSFKFATAADMDGTGYAYLGDHPAIPFSIITGDTPAELATALQAAIAAKTYQPFTAAVDGEDTTKVNLTFPFDGSLGNDVPIYMVLPTGIATTVTTVQPTGGATDPTIDDTYTALFKNREIDLLLCPWILVADDMEHIEGVCAYMEGARKRGAPLIISAYRTTAGTYATWAAARNKEYWACLFIDSAHAWASPPAHQAASILGWYSTKTKPHVPCQAQVMNAIKRMPNFELDASYDTVMENVIASGGGIATVNSVTGETEIERLVTTKTRLTGGVETDAYASPHIHLCNVATRRYLMDSAKARHASDASKVFFDGKQAAEVGAVVQDLFDIANDTVNYGWISAAALRENLDGVTSAITGKRIGIGALAPYFVEFLGVDITAFYAPAFG